MPCLHSVGAPGDASPWPCDDEKYIAHFPETREIWSYGSGYGGNALLGKKCLALRIASVMARDEGWLAEHMLILKLTSPEGRVKYLAAAFPSACGKTNLAMLVPSLPGWTVEMIGDDIAWMRVRGRQPAAGDQPRGGTVRRRARHRRRHQPERDRDTRVRRHLHQLRPHGRRRRLVGGHDARAARARARLARRVVDAGSGRPAAHPNARFTVAAAHAPTMAPEWEDPAGVPIDAIVFGGRRSTVVPLVQEAHDWEHGVFLGSIMASETTAAAAGERGRLRRDPFAMLPFCGYDMGDYFAHWLRIGQRPGVSLPRIFGVNWFRKRDGEWLWPGFGENARVLEWIHRRCDDAVPAVETPIGLLPGCLDVDGLSVDLDELLHVDPEEWRGEIAPIREFYASLGASLPAELQGQLTALERRLS